MSWTNRSRKRTVLILVGAVVTALCLLVPRNATVLRRLLFSETGHPSPAALSVSYSRSATQASPGQNQEGRLSPTDGRRTETPFSGKRTEPEVEAVGFNVRVVDKEERGPIAGSWVEVFDRTREGRIAAATTGDSGGAGFSLPSGRYRIVAGNDGYNNDSVALDLLASAPDRWVELALFRSLPVVGRVSDQRGEPIRAACVEFQYIPAQDVGSARDARPPVSTKTGPDGGFECALHKGEFILGVGNPVITVKRRLRIDASSGPIEVVLPIPEQRIRFTGSVRDSGGLPLPGTGLSVIEIPEPTAPEETRPHIVALAVADAQGLFSVELQPLKQASVLVQPDKEQACRPITEDLSLLRDTSRQFSLPRIPTFEVHLFDEKGQEVQKGWLVLSRGHGSTGEVRMTGGGEHFCTDYPVWIWAVVEGGLTGATTVRLLPGYQPKVDLHLVNGGELGGIVADYAGRPVEEFNIVLMTPNPRITFISALFFPADGSFLIRKIPPGEYLLLASAVAHGLFSQSITIQEGARCMVDISLPRRQQ